MRPQVAESSSIEKITNISSIDNIDTGYIYFGRPSCPHCELFSPLLQSAAKEKEQIVHYINTDEIESVRVIDQLIKKYDIVYVPHLVKIKDGSVIKIFNNSSEEDEEKTLSRLRSFFSE